MSNRIKWRLETRKVSALKPYQKNPRIITEAGLKQLKESFDQIGLAQPVNINTDNTILSGHARCNQLMLEDPTQTIDVYVPDRELTDKEEEAVIVRMNKNVAGQWDFDKLANEFEMNDLMEWGFEPQDFDIDTAEETDLPDLGDGQDSMIKKVTFTLSTEQADIIDEAIKQAKQDHECTDGINENRNGNALGEIARHYVSR